MGSSTTLIARTVSARFLALLLHFLITCVVFYVKIPLIKISVDPTGTPEARAAQYQSADVSWTTACGPIWRRLVALLSLTLVGFIVEIVGLFSGVTLYHTGSNATSAILHACGFLATATMVLNGWTIGAYPLIFTFCSLFPAITEVGWVALQLFTGQMRLCSAPSFC